MAEHEYLVSWTGSEAQAERQRPEEFIGDVPGASISDEDVTAYLTRYAGPLGMWITSSKNRSKLQEVRYVVFFGSWFCSSG